jgi:hypothetical protein
MLPKPTTKGLKTWPDEDRTKINPRGKQVAVETEPVWLLFEPDLGWYGLLKAEFSMWGVRTIGFIDALEARTWLMGLVRGEAITDIPRLAVISLNPNDLLIFPDTWDWLLQYFRRYEILQATPIVLLCTAPLTPEQEILLKTDYIRVKRVIPKPLPAMNVLRTMLFEAVQ